jgi:hypothetical protein
MSQIIIPARHRADNGSPFADLVDNPQRYRMVANRIAEILAGSFAEDERRHGKDYAQRACTQQEQKRRTEILGRWFRELRGDLGWSIERTLDHLAKALRTELDGGTYTPPVGKGNRLWVPGG